MTGNLTLDDRLYIHEIIHEIGHAVMYELCGWHVVRIVIDFYKHGVCEAELKPHKYRKYILKNTEMLVSCAGTVFEIMCGADTETIIEKTHSGAYDRDLENVPNPGTQEFENLKDELNGILYSLNQDAVRALVIRLSKTPVRSGKQVMSGRRFRKIIRDSGGLRRITGKKSPVPQS